MYGTENEWTFVKNQYLTVQVPSKRSQLMKALAKSRDGALLGRYLEYALDGKIIKQQEISTVIRYVGGNINGRLLAWRFVQRNSAKLRKWFGDLSFTLNDIIKDSTSEFSTRFDLEEVQNFFKSHDAGPGNPCHTDSVRKHSDEHSVVRTEWGNSEKLAGEKRRSEHRFFRMRKPRVLH
uniref:Aminopeptidase N-like n=1 Tax=Crassostrea virginica TaxID=6565 RepID=A0A8B8DTX2_CRAVI|nr:aminopeptidase N-like [Crassostrea virginica]